MLLYQLDYSISWATLSTGPLYQLGHSINRATLSTGPLYQPRHSINRATLLTGLLYQLSHSISWATLSIGTILTTRPLLLPHLYSETSPTAKIKDLFFQTGKFPVQTGFPRPPQDFIESRHNSIRYIRIREGAFFKTRDRLLMTILRAS